MCSDLFQTCNEIRFLLSSPVNMNGIKKENALFVIPDILDHGFGLPPFKILQNINNNLNSSIFKHSGCRGSLVVFNTKELYENIPSPTFISSIRHIFLTYSLKVSEISFSMQSTLQFSWWFFLNISVINPKVCEYLPPLK